MSVIFSTFLVKRSVSLVLFNTPIRFVLFLILIPTHFFLLFRKVPMPSLPVNQRTEATGQCVVSSFAQQHTIYIIER